MRKRLFWQMTLTVIATIAVFVVVFNAQGGWNKIDLSRYIVVIPAAFLTFAYALVAIIPAIYSKKLFVLGAVIVSAMTSLAVIFISFVFLVKTMLPDKIFFIVSITVIIVPMFIGVFVAVIMTFAKMKITMENNFILSKFSLAIIFSNQALLTASIIFLIISL